MRWRTHSAVCVLFFAAAACPASSNQDGDSPAFTTVPELASGFHLLYAQDFSQAREKFGDWGSQHPEEPFGEVVIAASYLFEELFRQGVLSSDFFLNEKRFLHGIDGKPDPERMKSFQGALDQARKLAKNRLAKNNRTRTTRTWRWAPPTTLSGAFRAASASCSGSAASTVTSSWAWRNWEKPSTGGGTCSLLRKSCWH